MKHFNNFPCLKGNYDADGEMAVAYFSNLGFRKLAFFGVENLEWSSGRFKSFKHYAAIKEIAVFDYMLRTNNKHGLNHNFKDLIRWLKALPKPIGVLCCNDDFGQILIDACSMEGLKVPHEIAILGVDNDELLCDITYPKLSSIARNHVKAAFNACEVLDKLMNGAKKTSIIISTEPLEVIVRSSTDTIASDEMEVVKAIQYIRNFNPLPLLTVEDVVNATNLSRRGLYTKFRLITGSTINKEIQAQKMKKFKDLLKDKHLSVKEAAYKLGFDDVSHVSRWFSSIEGVSPAKWRHQN